MGKSVPQVAFLQFRGTSRREIVPRVEGIHTAQGLEFDYVGVLTGSDLSYDLHTGDR